MNCKLCQDALPNLLFDPAAPANGAARAHIAACAVCAHQLASLQATLSLLDAWQAPEVSPYFDQKLAVRLREMQSAPPAGWFEQLKTRLLLNTGRHLRPALAGALALVLVAAGGSFGIATFQHPRPVGSPRPSTTSSSSTRTSRRCNRWTRSCMTTRPLLTQAPRCLRASRMFSKLRL